MFTFSGERDRINNVNDNTFIQEVNMNKYEEYERRKRELQNQNLSPEEYEKAIKKLAKELNIQ